MPRNFRVGGLSEELVNKLVFPNADAAFAYGKAVEVYHRRHRRLTQIEEPRVVIGSHVIAGITDWWAKFGEQHPEWFAMRADGERGLKIPRAGAWTPLCVSNAELQQAIVTAWDGGDVLTLGEAGRGRARVCATARTARPGTDRKSAGYPEDLRLLKYTPRAMGERLRAILEGSLRSGRETQPAGEDRRVPLSQYVARACRRDQAR